MDAEIINYTINSSSYIISNNVVPNANKLKEILLPLTQKINLWLSNLPGGLFLWTVIISLVLGYVLVSLSIRSKSAIIILTSIIAIAIYLLLKFLGV